MSANHDAALAIARQQVEKVMRAMIASPTFADATVRRGAFVYYLQSCLALDAMLVERFTGGPVFSQQFEGDEAVEVSQHALVAANAEDSEVLEFTLYSNVGDELRTGGGAAPACTLRRVA